ncbi:hypothetical protein [Nostoc sp. DedQUE09]|uniref:hypothetical protein n=1 Tax=Nostoc sp. DedQUE09 TaxID=3075394 RepID=UPI002AD4E686|nr:hypothetical protein [Nostoc sp. DedQUE09]MDZ7951142.1 hypothetical protein [Nostoc sp. DedQUE09]
MTALVATTFRLEFILLHQSRNEKRYRFSWILDISKIRKVVATIRVDCNLVGCVVQGTNLRSFEFLLQPLLRLEQPFGIRYNN